MTDDDAEGGHFLRTESVHLMLSILYIGWKAYKRQVVSTLLITIMQQEQYQKVQYTTLARVQRQFSGLVLIFAEIRKVHLSEAAAWALQSSARHVFFF